MLKGFFDDSADERRKRYFAAGGLIAVEAQLERFYKPWLIATRELKEPFRSTDCECQHGQFEDWPKKKCDRLMEDLVTILLNLELHGFASIVPIAEYRAVFPRSNEYDPYYLAVRHTIINMAQFGADERRILGFGGMDCWFEDSQATSSTTRTIYNELKAVTSWQEGRCLSGIHFNPKRLAPLQAADLIAREAFKHLDNLGRRGTRIPLRRLSNNVAFIVWSRETLEYLADNGGPENLELLTSWGSASRAAPPRFVQFLGQEFLDRVRSRRP